MNFGQLDTQKLDCKNYFLFNDGEGDCYIFSKKYLKSSITSLGNVNYWGNPTETVLEDNGKGEFYKK